MDNSEIRLGDFFRVNGDNIRRIVIQKDSDGVYGLRTYNRDPKKYYCYHYRFEEIVPIEIPKIRVNIFKEAIKNFYEAHGNFWFDNLTYVEILGKLTPEEKVK